MNRFVLLLGSNLGDRRLQLHIAARRIEEAGIITSTSKIYETAAWGHEGQPAFYNQVLVLHSSLEPEAILKMVNKIEKELGRMRTLKWQARIIDIDILYCNQLVLNSKDLIIPHPEIQRRRFTLVPLCELDPDYIHPLLLKTNLELLQNCQDYLEVQAVKEE